MKFQDYLESIYVGIQSSGDTNPPIYTRGKLEAVTSLLGIAKGICKVVAIFELTGKFLLLKAKVGRVPLSVDEIRVQMMKRMEEKANEQTNKIHSEESNVTGQESKQQKAS